MTAAEWRELARQANDRDAAAGLLPSRYVTDETVLHQVARLLLDQTSATRRGVHAA